MCIRDRQQGLQLILEEIKAGLFEIEPDVEDVHSQVELLLTRRIGEAGKKIHAGRSRNDQVAVDIKLFLRAEPVSYTHLRAHETVLDLVCRLLLEKKKKRTKKEKKKIKKENNNQHS